MPVIGGYDKQRVGKPLRKFRRHQFDIPKHQLCAFAEAALAVHYVVGLIPVCVNVLLAVFGTQTLYLTTKCAEILRMRLGKGCKIMCAVTRRSNTRTNSVIGKIFPCGAFSLNRLVGVKILIPKINHVLIKLGEISRPAQPRRLYGEQPAVHRRCRGHGSWRKHGGIRPLEIAAEKSVRLKISFDNIIAHSVQQHYHNVFAALIQQPVRKRQRGVRRHNAEMLHHRAGEVCNAVVVIGI